MQHDILSRRARRLPLSLAFRGLLCRGPLFRGPLIRGRLIRGPLLLGSPTLLGVLGKGGFGDNRDSFAVERLRKRQKLEEIVQVSFDDATVYRNLAHGTGQGVVDIMGAESFNTLSPDPFFEAIVTQWVVKRREFTLFVPHEYH